MCLIIGHLIEPEPPQRVYQPSQKVLQPSQRVPHNELLQGAPPQVTPITNYNPNVIGESGHGMFANVIYKCNCYSIITYVHTLMFHWNIVMVAIR